MTKKGRNADKMANKNPVNNNKTDRGANKRAGNSGKLSAEDKRNLLAKQLKLTSKEKAFIDELISNKKISNTEAYIRTHSTENRNTAAVNASKTLSKTNVQIYKDSAIKKAKERIVSLIDSENESIALKASADVLDRTEGKAVQKTENTTKTVEVKLDLTGLRIGSHFINSNNTALEP